MTSGIEIGVAGYRLVGTRPPGPSGERIADIVHNDCDARTADPVVPTIRSVVSLGRQSADRHGSVRGARRFLAEKHREAARSKQRNRLGTGEEKMNQHQRETRQRAALALMCAFGVALLILYLLLIE